ncbi:hypothetical protein ES692_01165 [Psychroserpens burtonensis]|uniref:DUF3575 domain-containing protein n=1 Tax=Psychroserpens burtonensis TaxID=49278 RepID=A0A5C7BK65_9FLAO|nr:hypothetical protein [Psychroserpens burtonensis]TXE19898.1 hypothetical protein ES692_01165 [Psychroserpens burtonensis]
MKKIMLILLFLSFILNGHAQDETNKLKLHSISLAPLNLYFANRDGGFVVNLDVGFNYGKHIFKVYAGQGSQFKINFIGEAIQDSFDEYNIMYGRELQINEWLHIDFFGGLGFFNFKYDENSRREYTKGSVGLPLQSKIRFNINKNVALGLQLHSNINSATSIYQPGIFVQWRL